MHLKSIYIVILATGLSLAVTLAETLLPELRAQDGHCYDSYPQQLCGVQGTLKNESTRGAKVRTTKTALECRIMCQYESCGSLFFDADQQYCKIWHDTLQQQDFIAGQGPTGLFYNTACFDCLETCPPAPHKNVLLNSGFEQFSDSIVPWKIFYLTLGSGCKSKQALYYGSGGYQNDNVNQPWYACENTTYTISFDYKIRFSKERVKGAGITLYPGNGVSFHAGGFKTPNDTWISAATNMTYPNNGYTDIALQMLIGNVRGRDTSTGIFLDNVKIVPIGV